MNEIQEAMTVAAQRAGDAKQGTRNGIVEGYDPDTFSVKVRLQPTGVLTGWIPVATCWVGNGWGFAAAPTIGDAVQVDMAEGAIDAGLMTGSFFNDVDRAMGVPSGELWIRHKAGAHFKLTNDGKAMFSDGHGAAVTLNGDGTISSTGTWAHDGSITATGDVAAGSISLQGHKHTGVRAGGDTSGSATP
jgi:phage baseplate assembly protein V